MEPKPKKKNRRPWYWPQRRYYVDGHISCPAFAVVRNSDVRCNFTVFAECESARNAAKIAKAMNDKEKTEAAEPLAAIIQFIRYRADNYRHDGWESVAEELEDLADRVDAAAKRIEAAAERERDVYNAIISGCEATADELAKERDRAVQYANAAPHPGSASWKEMQVQARKVATLRDSLVEILNRTKLEKERDYDAALNGGILEIHDIANTALAETKGE